jgi:hypothetical protein
VFAFTVFFSFGLNLSGDSRRMLSLHFTSLHELDDSLISAESWRCYSLAAYMLGVLCFFFFA